MSSLAQHLRRVLCGCALSGLLCGGGSGSAGPAAALAAEADIATLHLKAETACAVMRGQILTSLDTLERERGRLVQALRRLRRPSGHGYDAAVLEIDDAARGVSTTLSEIRVILRDPAAMPREP